MQYIVSSREESIEIMDKSKWNEQLDDDVMTLYGDADLSEKR